MDVEIKAAMDITITVIKGPLDLAEELMASIVDHLLSFVVYEEIFSFLFFFGLIVKC